MRKLLPLALLLYIATAHPSAAGEARPAPVTIADVAFFAGHWSGEEEGNLSEEVWTAPSGDSMVGLWRWVADGKLKLYESLAVVADERGVSFLLRHFDRKGIGREEKEKPITLRAVRASGQEVVFEGKDRNGGPLGLTYRREGDLLVVVLDKAGKKEEFRMKRRG